MATHHWIEIRLLIPSAMQEEAACYLTDLSGRGVIVEDEAGGAGTVIRAFWPPEDFGPWLQQELQDYLARLSGHNLFPLGLERRQVAAEDWANAWKQYFKPVRITPRLVIRPPWEDYHPAADEMVLTIQPGMAFGTGRHPTTALCLEAMERVWDHLSLTLAPPAWEVLDVGTGTGILALAAGRRGARVLAIDVDPEAVAAALDNVRLNALEDFILVEDTPLNALRQQFPLILANLTAPDLHHWAAALAGRLLAGGALIISGFLTTDLPAVLSRFLGYGLHQAGTLSRDDWVALILRRPH